MIPPIEQQEKAKQHTAQVGEVSHPGIAAGDASPEFDSAQDQHEPFCLQGDGREKQYQDLIIESLIEWKGGHEQVVPRGQAIGQLFAFYIRHVFLLQDLLTNLVPGACKLQRPSCTISCHPHTT